MKNFSAYIGFDRRFPLAYAVTVRSLMDNTNLKFPVTPLVLPHLQALGVYDRPMSAKDGQMFDDISGAPMATEFAISRFFIPFLSNYTGYSLFCDSDFLWRSDIQELLEQVDTQKAITCVHHNHCPVTASKMDGQMQTLYKRKNWSSMMIINNEHPSNRILEPGLLNALPGRDFHALGWLDDSQIGAVDASWNWLAGHSDPDIDPDAVHFTDGTPDMPGYKTAPYADEWRAAAQKINICRAG